MLHPHEPGLDQGRELGEVAFGQVGQGSFQVRPERFDGVELGCIRRELIDSQPVPGRDQFGHAGAAVGIEVVPLVCPAVLCGQRRLAAGVAGGDRLDAAAAGHIMITARRAS